MSEETAEATRTTGDGRPLVSIDLDSALIPPTAGLSDAEAARRRAEGMGNVAPVKTTRTYKQIVRENVFNFINNVLFVLGILLIALGRYLDALISVGVVGLNSIVSLIQEIRAKILLDRIAILTRPKATVIRNGAEHEVDPSEIVLGDLLVVHTGDQIVVDGGMVAGDHMEVDESLLTGESDTVPKHPGDHLLSGSFVVTGGGHYVATKVGAESFANKLTASAQAFRRVLTPLQRRVNFMIRSMLLLVLAFEILVLIKALVLHLPFVQTVRMSVVVVALVPVGLILAIALAYALGAVRMAGKGALVQQANSVESMSNVDVLCMDKTGTLTTNTIRLHSVHPLGVEEARLTELLGVFAASASEGNRTSEALRDAYGGRSAKPIHEVPFSSVLKWSAMALDEDGLRGTYVLGAPEMIEPSLAGADGYQDMMRQWADAGLRVLLFAHRPEPLPLRDPAPEGQTGHPRLPERLVPLGLVSLSDELRPKVQETLDEFTQAGIKLKIISGDNPQTVASLARQAGLPGGFGVMSGPDLEDMDDERLGQVAEETTVFGRVTPQQKERLVSALRARGHYVAMIGDGVNDVISLKRANVAVAMQGGSQAARAVSDMILLKDSFGALPWAFREGQRIFNGMQDILKIFMVRIFTKAALIGGVMAIGGFAFQPRQSSIISFFAAGIPAIALALFAKPGAVDHEHLGARLVSFVVPASLLQSFMGIALFTAYALASPGRFDMANPGGTAMEVGPSNYAGQTTLTVFIVFCSLILIPLVVPPSRFFVGGSPLRKDWKPTVLAVMLLVGFMAIALSELGRLSFDLKLLDWRDFFICATAAGAWGFGVRWMWRTHVLGRFLGVDPPPESNAPPD